MANINISPDNTTKRNRWLSTAWVVGIVAVILVCLVLQQTALLYIISTVGVSALLVIVAMADLGGEQNSSAEL